MDIVTSTTATSSTPPAPSKFKTIAFFDLETTGLPDLEFGKTKITELTIIAVSVKHLLQSTNVPPRVQHKLTLCFNPFKMIDINATAITGLTNELLEHESKFDKNSMNLFECFLFKLQQPVCLVAHNGNNFDFPLIKKQFETLDAVLPFTLKCCDSLPVFQKIDEDLKEESLKLLEIESQNFQEWKEAHADKILPEIEPLAAIVKQEDDGMDAEFMAMVEQELEVMETEVVKPKDEFDMTLRQAINETTPNKPTKPMNLKPVGNSSNEVSRNQFSSTRRELFPATQESQEKTSYKLREIYKRFFEEYPENSHDSESDVVTLMECAVACKKDFIKIVNENCIDFKDIKKV